MSKLLSAEERARIAAEVKNCEHCEGYAQVVKMKFHRLLDSDAERERLSGELLAALHSDGGQYVSEHGWEDAYSDAPNFISSLRGSIDEVLGLLAKSDAEIERLRKCLSASTVCELLRLLAERDAELTIANEASRFYLQKFVDLQVLRDHDQAELDELRKDKDRLGWLEKTIKEHLYRYDIAIQSDEEDGVWFSRVYRRNCGELHGEAFDETDSKTETIRAAIDAAREGRG